MKTTSSPKAKKTRAFEEMASQLRSQIQSGALKTNDLLLPEKQLALEYKISIRVVRECLSLLETEGLVSRVQGRGTTILPLPVTSEKSKQKNVAVIFLERIRDASSMEFFDSLQQSFQHSGYGTTFLVSNTDPVKEVEIVKQLVSDGYPGIILFSAHESKSFEHLKLAQEAGVKIALFDHYFPGFDCNFVGIDDRRGAYDATAHLIRLGCDDLIFLTSSVDMTTHTLRQQGFEEAMKKMGSGLRSRIIQVPLFEAMEKPIRNEFQKILQKSHRRLGIVSWYDQAAIIAMKVLQESGISIPRDASVISFADDQESSTNEIPLTSMRIPRIEIARLCAMVLIDQMKNPDLKPQHICLEASLRLRDSCGCYTSRPNARPKAAPSVLNRATA